VFVVSIHILKLNLLDRVPGLSGLIMQYEGGGRQRFTATVDGRNVPVVVDPGTSESDTADMIVAAIEKATQGAT
jgi:hypothetical protein